MSRYTAGTGNWLSSIRVEQMLADVGCKTKHLRCRFEVSATPVHVKASLRNGPLSSGHHSFHLPFHHPRLHIKLLDGAARQLSVFNRCHGKARAAGLLAHPNIRSNPPLCFAIHESRGILQHTGHPRHPGPWNPFEERGPILHGKLRPRVLSRKCSPHIRRSSTFERTVQTLGWVIWRWGEASVSW
jgi:hypothetical protein